MMKIYKTSIASLPLKSCADCPNRISKRFPHHKGFYSQWVCGAITFKTINPITREIVFRHRFPSLAEALQHKGFHPECPLENYTPKGDTK